MKRFILLTLFFICSNLQANDFPTLERVKFINECMAIKGGQSYQNMYSCSCKLDYVADKMSFAEFEIADAYNRMRNMRGERGGYFRSSKTSREIRGNLNRILNDGDKHCFTKQIQLDNS